MSAKKQVILGCFEFVDFPLFGAKNICAKVDTGAFSGAIDCKSIKVVRRKTDGVRVLVYTPFGRKSMEIRTENFQETYARSATGHRIKRYIIKTEIIVQKRAYPITIGLSNRSEMKSPVLIGRRFIRENNMLVDVTVNQEFDTEGKNTL